MKTSKLHSTFVAAALAVLASTGSAQAQGTAFTYEGMLNSGSSLANGFYDIRFNLHSTASGGSALTGAVTATARPVTNGLFAVLLDFGNQFPGADRWLEIAVRTNGPGSFVTLAPRQKITATPYAITAGNVTGPVPINQLPTSVVTNGAIAVNLSGSFTGNGAALTNVNATTLNGLNGTNFWRTTGNAGTTAGPNFLGTTDNQPLDVKVNGRTALRIAPTDTLPNIIGGLAGARPTVIGANVRGAVVAGGNAPSGGVTGGGGGDFHAVYDSDGTVSGGFGNKVGSNDGNPDNAAFGTVSGGVFNNAVGYAAAVNGGDGNTAGTNYANVAGGAGNRALGLLSTVGGGQANLASGTHAVIAGGGWNTASGLASFIGGGGGDVGAAVWQNVASGDWSSVVGGGNNAASGIGASVGGGQFNVASGQRATIPGGYQNLASGSFSTALGKNARADRDNSFVWNDGVNGNFSPSAPNQFAVHAFQGMRLATFVTNSPFGGALEIGHPAQSSYRLRLGYMHKEATDPSFADDFGRGTVQSMYGLAPSALLLNPIGGDIGIGTTQPGANLHLYNNSISPAVLRLQSAGTPGFGRVEFFSNPIGDVNEWRPGFIESADNGGFTGAIRFVVNGTGSFSKLGQLETMRIVNGRVGIGTTVPTTTLQVGNATCNGTTWANASDRNIKENFTAVDGLEVLEKVAALPLSEWNYKSEGGTRHIGPMAQDFKAAFGTGTDDKHISTVDADGVALAAIQGLNQKLETENAALKARLEKLEQLVEKLAAE